MRFTNKCHVLLRLCLGVWLLAAAISCHADPAGPPPDAAGHPSFSASQSLGVIWKNRIAESNLWSSGGWSLHDSTLSIPRDQAFCAFPEELTDCAIRVRFVYDGPGGSFIDLITRSDGRAANVRYVVTTFIGKESDHRANANLRVKPNDADRGGVLGGSGTLAQLKPGEEHTLELYALGEHLTFYFDGRKVIDFLDSKLSKGKMCLFTGAQVHYLSVETADLAHAPPLAGTSSPQSKPAPVQNVPATPQVVVAARTTPVPAPVAKALPPIPPAPRPETPANAAPSEPTTPSESRSRTATAGGQSGKDFSETQPDGGLLVGLEVWKGTYYRDLVIGGIRAIYQTGNSRVHGQIYGRADGDPDAILIAKSGAGITKLETMDDKEQIVAMRVAFANGEQSQWFGREILKNLPLNRLPKNIEIKHLTTGGKPASGIYGGAEGTLFRLGLLY